MPDIVENAVFLDSSVSMPTSNTKMPNTAFMHSFYSVYKTDSAVYVIKLYAEMALNNKGDTVFSRAYQLKDIKKIAALGNGVLEGEPSLSGANTATIDTIADLVSVVKQFDPEYNPKPSSRVVNEDGSPKVVYHGTNKKFNVFNSQSGLYWFSEYEDYAESMMEERGGGEVKAVYLNMRNPYRAKLPPGQFSDPTYEAEIIRKAKAGKHDGIIIENDTTDPLVAETFYVVFKPEQIKSATDNIGTFDKDNPDIRYSISDTQAETEDQQEVPDTPTAREQLPKKALLLENK